MANNILNEVFGGKRGYAVVVIDMQNDFCSEKSPATRGDDFEFKRETGTHLGKLLKETRGLNLPIIHVKTVHSEWTDTPTWLGRNNRSHLICRKDSWGQEWWDEFPENWPKQNEYVVTKHRYSAFIGTDLDLVLRSKRLESVLLTGVATGGCVDATAKDGFMMGYSIVVLSDCTAAKTRKEHEDALRIISPHHGILTTSEEVIGMWKKISK